MKNKSAFVSTIKSVVLCVKNLDESRVIFEEGLGLKCAGETTTSASEIGEIWGVTGGEFRAARFAREGEDFGCVDLVENKAAEKQIRDSRKPFDYGILTLNYRTNKIEKAVAKLESLGAVSVSEILQYNVGKPMSEKMMILPTGERLTIIQIGDAAMDEPFFNEAIATAGMVVPSMADAKQFYEDALGLTLSISFQAANSPFDKLLGVATLDKLDFATLTADGNWTGKVELLELETGDNPINTNEFADFLHTGYTFLTFLTPDLDKIAQNCRDFGAKIVVEPIITERPFHAGKRAMIVRSIGGEYLEFIEN